MAKNKPQRWILWGIPVLILLGFPMHFIYEWSGNSVIVGVFAPVNESVWEHLKLVFWPMMLWWLAGFCLYRNEPGMAAPKWFVPLAAAGLTAMIVITGFYYTYTGALGIESLVMDILSMVLAVAAAQLLALHLYQRADPGSGGLIAAIAVLVLLAAAFTVFTFCPPHIPLFEDSTSGLYGMIN